MNRVIGILWLSVVGCTTGLGAPHVVAQTSSRVPTPSEPAPVSEPTPPSATTPAPAPAPLSEEAIAAVLMPAYGRVKSCYDVAVVADLLIAGADAPEEDPRASDGKVQVGFHVDETGAVSDAEIASATIDDPDLRDCILDVIKRLSFPARPNGESVRVTHTYELKGTPP